MAQTQDVHIVQTAADGAKGAVHVAVVIGESAVGGVNDVFDTGIDLAQELKNMGIDGLTVAGNDIEKLLGRLIDRAAGVA